MPGRDRFVALIVACPMFLQNVDLFATMVAVPQMAQSFDVPVLNLTLVIAAYALSLAAFLPLSAWLADRFGAKRIFCTAIVVFSGASALCGAASSPGMLVLCRILQGFGAAMMVPVGRLILLRSVNPSDLLVAMVWFTIPPAVGRLLGPLVGGLIVTLASWRWIFYVNIPLGLIALLLATFVLDETEGGDAPPAFDLAGFLFMATGLGTTLGGLELLGKDNPVSELPALLIAAGAILLIAYGIHSFRREHPVIDLRILKYQTFRATILGATPLRLANAGVPFLLPLMLQLVSGVSALGAGLILSGSAFGAVSTRFFMRRVLRRFSFRQVLVATSFFAATAFAFYGLAIDKTPGWAIFGLVFLGGLLASLCVVSLNTLAFVDVPAHRTSHATAMLAMTQQLTSAVGVVLASGTIGWISIWRGRDGQAFDTFDFTLAFFVLGTIGLLTMISFLRLRSDEGDALR